MIGNRTRGCTERSFNMKRLIPLLILAIVFTIAPAAMANHCSKCTVAQTCNRLSNLGWIICEGDGETCSQSGWCGNHAAPVEPLATEFTVASVERLDEPQTTASETAIATLEAPKPVTR
jgi:hypothetical protein